MLINKVEIQDSNGNIFYPHTDSSIVKYGDSDVGSVLSEMVNKTTADITYYVNASTGSDTNNGLSSGTAFKTIQHAIDVLPQIINHTITINIASGTYNENITIGGFIGYGIIYLNGDTVQSNTRNVLLITVSKCICTISINGLYSTATSSNTISVYSSTNVVLQYIKIGGTTANCSGIYTLTSNVRISNSDLSNRQYAVFADAGSLVSSSNNSGSGNIVGLCAARASVIAQEGTQPNGSTTTSTISGGTVR